MQIRDALRRGIARLDEASVPSGALSAELLLIHVLGRDRTWLYTHPEDVIPHDREEEYFRLISRRVAGEPAQYITGKQEFWGLDFEVTSAVLIPRPETEYLVEVALARIGAENRSESVRIADVGTGSGCIAVTLAKELPNAQILATDISAAALDVAQRNAARHNVANQIQFAEADLLELTCHRSPTHPSQLFDLIVSNPPYVANSDRDTLQREIREHEPEIALFGGPTGLEIYAHLIEQAESRLAQNGVLVVESGYGAAERIREMIEARSVWQDITVTNDLAGIPRVLAASFTGGPRRE
ncbi:MAG TPA: peptide chain release factor N(5)-glutamine methyltransferase [Candidatus Aquilonibacter sp.]|nr:peptide chain release factor N(5)-glutamine methyltransferase [Candidatus Aquilonibacter sp.]